MKQTLPLYIIAISFAALAVQSFRIVPLLAETEFKVSGDISAKIPGNVDLDVDIDSFPDIGIDVDSMPSIRTF